MTDKDCKTCSYGWRLKGTNAIFCRHLHECKGGSPFKDDVETLKTLLKEAKEVLEYYKNSALKEDVIYEYPKLNDGSYRILDTGAGTIRSGYFVGVKPVSRCYLRIDTETADKMIKKIDEVL